MLDIDGSNAIVRHLRLRPGFFGGARGPCSNCERKSTALTIKNGAQHVIIDHVSMSWGNDSSLEIHGGTTTGHDGGAPARVANVTIQWSIVSEGITLDPVFDQTQGLTSFEIVDRVSLHHNLFAHNQVRNPSITTGGFWEIINNVLYDTPNAASELSDRSAIERVEVDYIGNYAAEPDAVAGLNALRLFKFLDERALPGFSVFLDGNIGPSRISDSGPDAKILACRVQLCDRCARSLCEAGYPERWLRATAAVPPSPKPVTVDFNPAYRYLWTDGLRDRVGATLPVRDRVDNCLVDHVDTWSGSVIQNLSQGCAAGGWTLARGTDVVDRDADGMPDAYEAQYPGILDEALANDGSQDADGDCYTNLEEFLNGTGPDLRDEGAVEAPSFIGIAEQDGEVVELDAGAGTGRLAQPSRPVIRVGDDTTDVEHRGVLAFDTSSLPDGATVCQALLSLEPASSLGGPEALGAIYVVSPLPRGLGFGGTLALEPEDFQASSTSQSLARVLEAGAGAFEAFLLPAAVNVSGISQLRLQVARDDADGAQDWRGFFSADASDPSLHPTLTVIYQP